MIYSMTGFAAVAAAYTETENTHAAETRNMPHPQVITFWILRLFSNAMLPIVYLGFGLIIQNFC